MWMSTRCLLWSLAGRKARGRDRDGSSIGSFGRWGISLSSACYKLMMTLWIHLVPSMTKSIASVEAFCGAGPSQKNQSRAKSLDIKTKQKLFFPQSIEK